MSAAKHTPGPWVHDTRGYPHPDVRGANGRGVAVTWGACSSPPKSAEHYQKRTDEDRANARLIAAAPRLLEELKKARAEIWRLLDAKGIDPKQARNWPEIVSAEAAINEATGSAA